MAWEEKVLPIEFVNALINRARESHVIHACGDQRQRNPDLGNFRIVQIRVNMTIRVLKIRIFVPMSPRT
jgi:hypothetical protein